MFSTPRRTLGQALGKVISKNHQFYTFRHQEKVKAAQSLSLNQRFIEMCILSHAFKGLLEWKWKVTRHAQQRSLSKDRITSDVVPFNPMEITMEVFTAFKAIGIDCVVGGSLVVMAYTLPRMTKDVDFHINLRSADPLTKTILHGLCAQHQWELVKFAPSSSVRSSSENKDLQVGFVSLKVKDVSVDLFLNDWAPAEYVHSNANEVSYPSDPPVTVRIAPPAAIAFFKTFTFSIGCGTSWCSSRARAGLRWASGTTGLNR